MRIKLDENLPRSAGKVLAAAGHEADSVHDEGLAGHGDEAVFRAVQQDRRVLMTLDRDFSDIRTYPTTHSPGVIVLRPRDQQIDTVNALISRIAFVLQAESPERALWIVSDDRIRVRR